MSIEKWSFREERMNNMELARDVNRWYFIDTLDLSWHVCYCIHSVREMTIYIERKVLLGFLSVESDA